MPGGVQGMDLQRQGVDSHRILQADTNETRDRMDIEQHPCFEAHFDDLTPLTKLQFKLLILDPK